MKKINKLSILAIVAITIFAINGCAKTQFQPANLVGTWNMAEININGKITTTYPNDPAVDGDIISRLQEFTRKYVGTSNMTGTSTSTNTYDGLGMGWKSYSETQTMTGDKTYSEETITEVGGVTTITKDTANSESSINLSITFNKDRTFTMTEKNMMKDTYSSTNTSFSNTYVEMEEENSEITGSWAFIGADKNLDVKDKERIGLWYKSEKTTNVETEKDTYVDNDATDGTDWTADNEETVTTDVVDATAITQTEPDVVWEMVEGTSGEMTVTIVMNRTGTSIETEVVTVPGTITTTTSNETSFVGETISTVKFTK